MSTRWSFFGFQWQRYQELKPILKAAWESGDYSNLNLPEADEILAHFYEDSDPSEICNTLIMELCGEGEPLHLEVGLPELIHDLRRRKASMDAAEHLGSLITSEPHVEDWWRFDNGLAGILTPAECKEAAAGLTALRV